MVVAYSSYGLKPSDHVQVLDAEANIARCEIIILARVENFSALILTY